jgi:hypothetical protein
VGEQARRGCRSQRGEHGGLVVEDQVHRHCESVRPGQGAVEHRQSRHAEEIDSRQVEDQRDRLVLQFAVQTRTEHGRRYGIDFADPPYDDQIPSWPVHSYTEHASALQPVASLPQIQKRHLIPSIVRG